MNADDADLICVIRVHLRLITLLLANLFVGSGPFEPYAAVRCRRFNRRAPRSEIKRDLLRDSTLNSYRKINADTSIHCASFEVSRVILRHRHHHAAVCRADVQTLTIPTIPAELDHQSAVRCRTTHGPANSLQNHPAVQSGEINASIHFRYRDTTIVRLHRKICAPRNEHFVANVPMIISATFRATCKDLRTAGLYSYLLPQRTSFFRRRRTRVDARADEDLILVPTFYRNASVFPAIDSDCPARHGQCLLSHFAVADQPVVPVVVVTTGQRLPFVLRDHSDAGESHQRSNQHIPAHDPVHDFGLLNVWGFSLVSEC